MGTSKGGFGSTMEDETLGLLDGDVVITEPINKLVEHLGVDIEHGLSSADSHSRRERWGVNSVTPPLNCPSWLCCLIPCLRNTHNMQIYNTIVPEDATVKRNSRWILLDAMSVVPGDIVQVTAGDRVAADMRVLESQNDCQVDKTFTTGEEGAVAVDSSLIEADIAKSRAILLLGDLCVQGSVKGVVVATGDKTYLAKAIAAKKWPPPGLKKVTF